MSLALAAQHLAAKGRHGDSTLVHMTPGEVAGLQALAHAHGQTLTINPETGLPEAFSLKSLLPMIAGAALNTFLPGAGLAVGSALGGLGGAAGTGLLVGGGTALATGSLQKGLMAGLGAYGGAGIAGGLTGAGATQGLNAASAEATAAGQAEAAKQLADANMMAKYKALADGTPAGQAFTPEAVAQSAREFASDTMGLPGGKPFSAATQATLANPMRAGAEGLMTEEGRKAFMDQMGGLKGLGKYGLAALSPLMMSQSGQADQRPTEYPHRFEFDAGATGAVQRPGAGPVSYFNPRLRQYAEGGSTGMTGQSDEYYRYLMGLAPAPSPYAAPAAAPAATQADTAPLAITNPMAARRDVNYSDPGSMAFDDPNNPQNPNSWGNLTPLQQAVFYAQNPIAAKATQLAQAGFALTPVGKLQAAMVPDFVAQQQAIANPGPGGYLSSLDFALLGMSPPAGKQSSNQSLTGGLLNFSGTQPDAPVDIAVPTISNAQAAQMMADEINASLNASLNAPAAPAAPAVEVGGPMDLSNPVGTNIGLVDANIGIDPSGFGGIDPGVAADVAAATDAGISAGIDAGEFARGGLSSLAAFAQGGYNLGDYSDGGRLLRGPGDGVSDSIPASIANKRPARLADGEFVVPARIVSELGNGSTEAGARQLYAMMDRIQRARKKSVGKGKVAVNSRASKLLPA